MDIKGKLELACKLVLEASDELPADLRETANAPSKIYLGADSEEQKRPCVVCWVQSGGEEEPLGSGNRFMRLTVLVKSPADADPESLEKRTTEHNARVEAVFGILKMDNLAQLLSETTVDGERFVTVYHPVTDVGMDADLAGRSFVDGLSFDCYACPSVVD